MKKRRACRPLACDSLEERLVPSFGGSADTTGAVQPADQSIVGTEPSTTPAQRTDAAAVQAHAAAVSLADSGGASGVVFFGDSITARWDEPGYPGLPVWNSEIAPLGAVDFGLDGDLTQDLIWRLENGELDGAPRWRSSRSGPTTCSTRSRTRRRGKRPTGSMPSSRQSRPSRQTPRSCSWAFSPVREPE